MALSGTSAYVLSKKYTEDTAISLGSLKGAPCQVESAIKADGVTTVVLKWVGDDKTTVNRTTLKINDGTPILTWTSGDTYKVGDIALYSSNFYSCITANSDSVFDSTKWNKIGDSNSTYGIVTKYSLLPSTLTSAEEKMYYVTNDETISTIKYLAGFYLWNGSSWVRTQPDVLDRFTEIVTYDTDGVTVKNRDLYFDGKKVLVENESDYQIVAKYDDIDTTVTGDTVFFVESPTIVDSVITHYSGNYYFNATDKSITFIDERETDDIDYDTEYTPIHEG